MIFESHPHSLHSWGTWMGCKSPSCCSQGRTSENPETLSMLRLAKFPLVSGCLTRLPRAERSLREPSGSSQKTMGVGARRVNYFLCKRMCFHTTGYAVQPQRCCERLRSSLFAPHCTPENPARCLNT